MVKRSTCSLLRTISSNTPAQAVEEGLRLKQREAERLPRKIFSNCERLLNQRINDMTKESLEEIYAIFKTELHDFFTHHGEVSIFGFKHFHHDHRYHRKDHNERAMLTKAIKELRMRMEIHIYGNIVFDPKKVGLHKKPTILSVLPPIRLGWFTVFLNLFK